MAKFLDRCKVFLAKKWVRVAICIIVCLFILGYFAFTIFLKKPSYSDLTVMYNNGEYETLLKKLESYNTKDPKDENIAILLARTYISFGSLIGKKDDYISKSISVINSVPISYNVLKTKGFVYTAAGNYELAQEAYRTALRLNKNDSDLIAELALTYEKQGDLKNAYLFFKKAFTIDSGNPKAGLGYFRIKSLLGEQDYVITRASAFLKNINDKEYLSGLYEIVAIEYAKKRDFENAEKMYKNSLSLKSNRIVSMVGLADTLVKTIYKKIGNPGETMEGLTTKPETLINDAIRLKPDYVYSYLVLLDIMRLRGDLEKTKRVEEKVISILKTQTFSASDSKIIEERLKSTSNR